MITDEDIKKLKETFATRDEFDGAKSDITTLKSDVATLKTDVAVLKTDVAELKVDSKLLQEAMIRLEHGMEENTELTRKMISIVEGLAGNIDTLKQENRMGAITLRRHGVQIHELAKATGTAISE